VNDFDAFIDKATVTLSTPISSASSKVATSYPDPNRASYVVVDEKSYKAGLLFAAINKGMTTLSFNHGMGLKITRNGEWVTMQIINAGCGRTIKHQSAPYSATRARASNTKKGDAKGKRGVTQAWSD